jgi:hypothetical protein
MENVTFIEIESTGGKVTHAIIDRGNGEFTSMLKSTYDAQFPSKPKKTISQSE